MPKKGYIQSENHKQKASQVIAGFWLGKKRPEFSEEWKQKIGIGNTGKKFTEEHKNKIGLANKGQKRSEEFRKRLSLIMTGKKKTKKYYWSELAKARVRGPNCTAWRGGITPLYRAVRNMTEYKLWRLKIFERDKFTCQTCGQKGGNLNADHIKPLSILLSSHKIKNIEVARKCRELWHLDNGRTLCKNCHKNTDTYGRLATQYTNKSH